MTNHLHLKYCFSADLVVIFFFFLMQKESGELKQRVLWHVQQNNYIFKLGFAHNVSNSEAQSQALHEI